MLEKYLNIFLVIFLVVSITPNAAFATSSLKDFSEVVIPVKYGNFEKQLNNTTATNENSKHSLSGYGIKQDNSKLDTHLDDKDLKSEDDLLKALNDRLENEFFNLKRDENISKSKVVEILYNYKIKPIFRYKSIEKLEKGDIILIRMSMDDKHVKFVKITGIGKNNKGSINKIRLILNGNTMEYTVDGLKKLYMNMGMSFTSADISVNPVSNDINVNPTSKPTTVVYTVTNERYLNPGTWDDIKEVARDTWNRIKEKSSKNWNNVKEKSSVGLNKLKQSWFYKNLDKVLLITGGTALTIGLGVVVVKRTSIMNKIINWWYGNNNAPNVYSSKSAYYTDKFHGSDTLKIEIELRTNERGDGDGNFDYHKPIHAQEYYGIIDGGNMTLTANSRTFPSVGLQLPPEHIWAEFPDEAMQGTPGDKYYLNEFMYRLGSMNYLNARGTYTINDRILHLRATELY